jgi:lipid-binding SYLF domain-containing protein
MFSPIRIAAISIVVLLAPNIYSQQGKKYGDALSRSREAARIITLLGGIPNSDLSKELVDRAEAIGVFPSVTQDSLFLTKITLGYGVISSRLNDGWSMPAYYSFSGGGYNNPFEKNEPEHGVIMLFMTKDAVRWFEKGGVPLTKEKKAVEGPVGALSDETRKRIEGVPILAYDYYNGKLDGKAIGKGFWKKFVLDPDNNINNPLYGMKGREVLAGQKIANVETIPEGIAAFRDALQTYYASAQAKTDEK